MRAVDEGRKQRAIDFGKRIIGGKSLRDIEVDTGISKSTIYDAVINTLPKADEELAKEAKEILSSNSKNKPSARCRDLSYKKPAV